MLQVRNGLLLNGDAPVEQMWSNNHGGPFTTMPKIVVVHFTAGGSARSSAAWFANPQNRQSSAHVVVERDGSIIQCVSFDKVAWHAGRSAWKGLVGLNRHSLGIEIANWGPLKPSGGAWVDGRGRKVEAPCLAVHRHGNPDGSRRPMGWEPYPGPQVEAVAELVRALCRVYPIADIIGHDDIAPGRKWDPGPAFDWARLRRLARVQAR